MPDVCAVSNRSHAGVIHLEAHTPAHIAVVWRCLTERDEWSHWGFAATGTDEACGSPARMLAVEGPKRRTLIADDEALPGEAGATIFIGEDAGETCISLLQSGFADDDLSERERLIADRISAWTHHLANLSAYATALADSE